MKKRYGIEFFSIGGGMGIVYNARSTVAAAIGGTSTAASVSAFSVEDYAAAIVPPLQSLGLRVLLEPGRFLVGNAGVLLTRVRYLKQAEQKKFVIVDAGHERSDPPRALPKLPRNRAGAGAAS